MQRTLERRLQRRERDTETAREALLNAAQEIFARDGFSGARVDDIARQAGCNKALIFHYFDDKVGLYQALMLRTKRRLFARLEEAFDHIFIEADEGITAERVHTFIAEYLDVLFDLCAEHPQIVHILAWEAAEGWQTFLSCALSTPDTMPQRAVGLLERAQAAGIVRAELDPRLLFTSLISLPLIHLISLPRFAATFPDADFTSPAAIAQAREQITEVMLHGFLSPATPDANQPELSYSSQATLASSEEQA